MDIIKTKVVTKAYSDGWDRIFGKKEEEPKKELTPAKEDQPSFMGVLFELAQEQKKEAKENKE